MRAAQDCGFVSRLHCWTLRKRISEKFLMT